MAKPPTPNSDRSLTGGLDGQQATRSLASELADVVDDARQLTTDLGFRPYRVFSVVERWSGGTRGRGTVEVVREVEFVPPPELDYKSLRRKFGPAGAVERGEVLLRKLSARYTEDEVFELLHRKLRPGEVGYIETRTDGRFGNEPHRRRFVVASVPSLDAAKFEWTVRLKPQDDARDDRGRPRRA